MARDRKWHSVIVSSNWQASQRCEDPPIEASICHFSSIRNKPHKLWNPTKYLWWINAVNATCKSVTRPSKSSCISNVQFSPENTPRIRKRYSPRTTLSLEILEIPEETLRDTPEYSKILLWLQQMPEYNKVGGVWNCVLCGDWRRSAANLWQKTCNRSEMPKITRRRGPLTSFAALYLAMFPKAWPLALKLLWVAIRRPIKIPIRALL